MINSALTFLKEHLDEHLRLQSAGALSGEDRAVFVDIGADGALGFKEGAITVLLVNAEEDRTMRPANPHRIVGRDCAVRRVAPEVAMNLHVLFVARFSEYGQSLVYLSRVIRHFQVNRVLTRDNAPTLSQELGQLTMELHTLTMQQQNDMWSMLKTGYQPSVLYRVKMIVFRDEDALHLPSVTSIDRVSSPHAGASGASVGDSR